MLDRMILDQFGETTNYYTDAGMSVVKGVFSLNYVKVENGRAGTSSADICVFYKLEDLPSDPRTVRPSAIVIRGISYKVVEIKPDLMDGITLKLHKS